ncbi:MAG: HEAT repeat domain-containing protein, partial [bacterium]
RRNYTTLYVSLTPKQAQKLKDLAKKHRNENVRLESVRILGQMKEKEFLKTLRSHEKATKVLELIKIFLP